MFIIELQQCALQVCLCIVTEPIMSLQWLNGALAVAGKLDFSSLYLLVKGAAYPDYTCTSHCLTFSFLNLTRTF